MEVVIIILAQILAISVHAYLLWYEKKYCSHCDWWWDTGAIINIVLSLIPVLGLFTSIAGCADYMRNVTKELTKDEHILDGRDIEFYPGVRFFDGGEEHIG